MRLVLFELASFCLKIDIILSQKIFGIGLNKTGTKTLGSCLKTFGLKHKTYDLELLESFSKGDYNSIFQIVDEFDSFEDWPWPLIYKELDEKYENSKFILTIRKDQNTWYNSLCKHAQRTGPTKARKIAYGYFMPEENRKAHLFIYNSHNESVINYFSQRKDKLLVVCWENGDSWEKLCNFLNFPIPLVNFPHENSSSIIEMK